jgi:hypothetical protein
MKKLALKRKIEKWNKFKQNQNPNINEFLYLLKECTICPMGNATCEEYFEIVIREQARLKKIRICPFGCKLENCILIK